jgi:REP element-mobilizing transposase RayT
MIRRLKSKHSTAIYHCISRIVNGEFLLRDSDKEVLRRHLHQVAIFCGVEIITYAILSNHFHVLVRVPPTKDISNAELLRRYKALYPKPTKYATAQIKVLEKVLKTDTPDAKKLRERLLARMGDVSEFMKTLKQRFSVWFNQTHKRFGTLWAERFTSIIVEGKGHFALRTMAAYIDLNPVRAGLAKDPKDYRWCGYGEAVAIGGPILNGLRHAMVDAENLSNEMLLRQYRMALFGKGTIPKSKKGQKQGGKITAEAFYEVEDSGGKLSLEERLLLRVKWFTRGAIIGGRQFVEEHLREYRLRTRRRQNMKPHPFTEDASAAWPDMFSMRSVNEKKGTTPQAQGS